MRHVLLANRKASAREDIRKWLDRDGLVAWFASDVSHANKASLDHAAHDRPDIVMLEAAFLADSFEAFTLIFNMSAIEDEVTVLGFTGEQTACARAFANDLHQLRLMMAAKNYV